MNKYYFFNEEPNVNILGLDPIILAFHSQEMKNFTGKRFSSMAYELDNKKFRAGTIKSEWDNISRYFFNKIKKDSEFRGQIILNIENRADKIYKLTKKTLEDLRKNKISVEQRKKMIKEIFSLYTSICVCGLIDPIIEFGYGGISNELKKILENKLNDQEKIGEYLTILSFFYEKNLDRKGLESLTKIAQEIYQQKDLKRLFIEESNIIEKISPDILKQIEEYVFQWGWLTYSYAGPEYKIENAINDLKNMLSVKTSPQKQLERLNDELLENKRKQENIITEMKFSQEELYMIKIAQDSMQTKYLRTKMMYLACFTINKLLDYFRKRDSLSFEQMGACTVREILDYFATGKLPDVNMLNQRLKYCVLISKIDNEVVLLGEEAKKWVKNNVELEKIDENISEFSGQVAYVSDQPIWGKVKIVNLTSEMEKFEQGDILVSITTTPDIVPAMKKARAIITDIGGLTCHASIVSRELKIPCIVGTKIATKILKDGDRVEVNTNKGIIKIIK